MSHFTVTVCLGRLEDLDRALAPFDENDERNRDPKWDWWVPGGRWPGRSGKPRTPTSGPSRTACGSSRSTATSNRENTKTGTGKRKMSAWIVSKTHIDYIVTAIIRAELTGRTPDDTGRMLWRECLASVAYRYPDDEDGERPGPAGFHDADVGTYTWAETPELTPAGLHMTLGCYRYQSCEHPGWNNSEAEIITRKLQDSLGVSSDDWPRDDSVPWG